MTLRVVKFLPDEWAKVSEDTHLAVFGTKKPASFDRISYALGVCKDDGTPVLYVTVRENDHESVYWQFGGALGPAKGSIVAYRATCEAIRYQLERAKRISFLVENDNLPMLHLAMKTGFRIVGVRYFKNRVLLEHLLESDAIRQ